MENTQYEQPLHAQADEKPNGLIKKALLKLFEPLRRRIRSIDSDFADRTPGKRALIAIYKLAKPLALSLAVVVIAAACFFVSQSRKTASVEMSLNYEESSKGLNPNSTRFNINDIASPEVVEAMLSYSGVDPESVELGDVIDCISISPTNKKPFSQDNYYISTTYRITMTMPKGIKGVRVDQLLHFLCKAYKDNLYSKYTENRSILNFDIAQFNEQEYLEIADLLDLKANQLEKYLNTRVKQSKTFTEQESDETFKSLLQKAENISNYDIAKYRVFVIEAGVSHDKPRYLRSLDYVNRINNFSYSKDITAYNVYNEGIRLYNKDMIDIVMIPSIDLPKNTYYMSKTKTGMDYMAKTADDYLATAQETQKMIQTNTEIMGKLAAGTNQKSDVDKAEAMIGEIQAKLSDLSGQIETIDKAYIKYKTKDYLTFKTTNQSLMQRLRVSTLFIMVVVLLLAVLVLLWIRFRFFSGGGKK